MKYYDEKNPAYFTNSRRDIISMLPVKQGLHVLELGAGGGGTLMDLKKSGIAAKVVGIEMFHLENTFQRDPLLDEFLIGNIEEMDLSARKESFDVVIMGDVLEHLIDPWAAVKKVSGVVKPGGVMIASIPNIRSKEAFRKIFLKGDFGYTSQGLFDKTHYRWFCKKNMIELMTPENFSIVSVVSNLEFKEGSGTRTFNRLTFRLFEEFLTVQFITMSKKAA
jgi:2-polyprenyl-3-methyl-5-hydroxy-6-metoxy-1,4-benzoquinol methylase